jgi:acyl-CoA thioesterase-1
MNKIVIIGDSLGLPRPELPYEETYPYILQKLVGPEVSVIPRNVRLNDTNVQLKMLVEDIELFKPDVVVMQLGIVDCAPRIFGRFEQKVARRLNRVFPIVAITSKYRYTITKAIPKVYVSKNKFRENLQKIFGYIEKRNIKLIVVGIADTSAINKSKSYSYEKNIIDYNNIIYETMADKNMFIDLYQYGDEILLEDGIHINGKGGKLLAERIVEKLKLCIESY